MPTFLHLIQPSFTISATELVYYHDKTNVPVAFIVPADFIVSISKDSLAPTNNIYELWQRFKFDTFKKRSFCTSSVKYNLVLKSVSNVAVHYLWKGFTFF